MTTPTQADRLAELADSIEKHINPGSYIAPGFDAHSALRILRAALAKQQASPDEQAGACDEPEACNQLRERMSDLLTRTANALQGEPPALTRWSWHDLPERAAAAIVAIEVMQKAAANLATPEAPEGWELVLVPMSAPGDEPDWDDCIAQAEEAVGIKMERATTNVFIREVRRWLAHKSATTPSAPQAAGADAVSLLALKQWLIEKGWWNKLPMSWFNALEAAIEHPATQVREQAALPAQTNVPREVLELMADISTEAHHDDNGAGRFYCHACGESVTMCWEAGCTTNSEADIQHNRYCPMKWATAALAQGTTPAAGVGVGGVVYSQGSDGRYRNTSKTGVGEQATGEHPPSRHCECADCVRYFDEDCQGRSTKPAQAEPMSDELIVEMWSRMPKHHSIVQFARAILAEAGIKEKT